MKRLEAIAEKQIKIRTKCVAKQLKLMADRALLVRELRKKVELLFEAGYYESYNKVR